MAVWNPRTEVLEETEFADTLIVNFQSPEFGEKQISTAQVTQFVVFC